MLELFLLFCTYALLGWVCETVYCSIGLKRFSNNALLHGPFSPLYGFGALLILALEPLYGDSFLLLYIVSLFAASALEYLTSFLLEKFLRLRLWDYSAMPWNIHGRVCLWNSFLFGLMGVFTAHWIHPLARGLIRGLPFDFALTFSLILLFYFVVDFFYTVLFHLFHRGEKQKI